MPITYTIPGFKRLFRSTGLTFAEFRAITTVSVSTLQNLCKRPDKVTPIVASRIAKGLGCTIADLIEPPSLKGALDDIVTELRLYRMFVEQVYEQYGEKLPEID